MMMMSLISDIYSILIDYGGDLCAHCAPQKQRLQTNEQTKKYKA